MWPATGYISVGDERVTLSLAHLSEKRLETELDERQQSGDFGATLINEHEGNKKKKVAKKQQSLKRAKPKVKLQMKTNLPARNL